MTNLERLTIKALTDWCKRNKKETPRIRPRHIHPRCYVIARPSGSCLIVACPPMDAEPQIQKIPMYRDGTKIINTFDDNLEAGDWCSVGYVCYGGVQETIAIQAVTQGKRI